MRSDGRGADASADAPIGLLVGDPRHEECVDEHSDGQAEASSFVAVATGSVTSLSIDYGGGTSAMLVLALYDDDSTSFAPRSLLATAVVSSGSALGMGVYSGPTDVHPQIVQGTRYWISVFCVGTGTVCDFPYTYTPQGSQSTCGGGGVCGATDSSCTLHSNSTTLTTPETTWSSGGAAFGLSVNSFWASGA